jgi:hypothetical protein
MVHIVRVYICIRDFIWLGFTFPFVLMTWFDMWREGKEYPNTSCPDALVLPHFPILRCDHSEEAHIKQSRHPSTTARAYYYCPYNSVSNILHVWILGNLALTSFFSYKSRIDADSFNGSMDLRRSIHKSFFFRMIGMSLHRCALSSIGFLCHQIHRQWQIRRRMKQLPIMFATQLHVNVVTILSWWTRLPGWITHRFGVVQFLYQ